MLSHTEENYLKAIYSLGQSERRSVTTNRIAKKMQTKASSVTDMIQKLADKKLVNYEKYKGVKLTSSGRKKAIKIVRKHRLWEVFLVDKLHYKWDEVHDLAEQLEHIKSDSLIDKLDAFLEFPTVDPHGDPIPDQNGKLIHRKNNTLASADIGCTCKVIGVKDSSSSFLQYLNNANIELGTILEVISKEDYDQSMIIKNGNKILSISFQISENLYINKV